MIVKRTASQREGQAGMEELGADQANGELKVLVKEASRALAALDSVRLEELALSCEALNRELARENDADRREEMARQAREAATDLAVFARVLEATRANLDVMKRLREMRLGPLEYQARGSAPDWTGSRAEDGDGNH